MTKQITLADLDVRCENLLKQFPNNPKCAYCDKPVDVTPLLGADTCCPYHRLLLDWYLYEEDGQDMQEKLTKGTITLDALRLNTKAWIARAGKDTCDQIVLHMAREAINWEC